MANQPESRFPPVALPDVPYAAEMQSHCLAFPEAWEDYPWGDIVYKVGKKMFATIGGHRGHLSMTVKATPADAAVLCEAPFISRAAYIGQHGWVSVDVQDDEALQLVKDLVAESFRLVAPKRLASQRPTGSGI